jgi:hypothetical protein
VVLLDENAQGVTLGVLTQERIKDAGLTADEVKAYNRDYEFLNGRLLDVARASRGTAISSLGQSVKLVNPVLAEAAPETRLAVAKLLKMGYDKAARAHNESRS